MLIPYLKVDPVAPVFLSLYDPAKSTKWNFEDIEPLFYYWSEIISCLTVIVKIACDRDELSFISVCAVERWSDPFYKMLISSRVVDTESSVSPNIFMLPPSSIIEGGSLFLRFLESDANKSNICSL